MDRRTFLAKIGAVGLSGVAGAVLGACGAPTAAARRRPATPRSTARISNATDHLMTAEWIVEENAHPGRTREWIIRRTHPVVDYGPAPIEGYVNQTSFAAGDHLVLRVSTQAPTFQALVYRMGYYGGLGGRRVAKSPELIGVQQPKATLDPDTRMIECHWSPSWTTDVPKTWPTGQYLIKLVGSNGAQQYVPFTVRDDADQAAYVVQSSVTTWQAYNYYLQYSLYGGLSAGEVTLDGRSYVVSFDRPYSHISTALDAYGSGDFFGNEFPFVFFAERHGLDVTYTTDVDLHANPEHLLRHHAFISLGHDEYWSGKMRDGAETARDHGVNLAFLGANACYRQIRFEPSPIGPNRRVVCYKNYELDPEYKINPALATGGSWATDPVSRPESSLIGLMYQSFGGKGALQVTNGDSWVFRDTGLSSGDSIPNVIGSEFDGYGPGYTHPSPDNVEILGHSPTTSQNGNLYSDVGYYSAGKGKGAVFATGTASWVSRLWSGSGSTAKGLGFAPYPRVTLDPLTKITLNVLSAFGPGPASERHPSVANWMQYYPPGTVKVDPKDVP